MHIPDGMLDPKTFGTLWAGGAGSIGYASWWIRKNLDGSKIVLMAVLAALIFGLQMLNFPIAAGTSGHFAGGALAGILLGAWPACIVMSAVLLVQALFFGDGGITTLGANIVNLGIIAPFVGAFIYELFQRVRSGYASKIAGAFTGAFVAVVVSSAAVALELWASNNAQFFAALGAMTFWHTIIGVGEGIITAGLIAYVAKVRPQLLGDEGALHTKRSLKSICVVLGALALIAAGLSFLASTSPDGLEFVYFDSGVGAEFEEGAHAAAAPMSDYLLPGVGSELLAGIGAGIVGVVLTGALILGLVVVLKRRAGGRDRTGERDRTGGRDRTGEKTKIAKSVEIDE
ncbi:MAG: PDGLE domain-containing protein [Coriobacteriia bacterium]|nr:PDGLE domain-containing protein [Coriobacteriia bacterium]